MSDRPPGESWVELLSDTRSIVRQLESEPLLRRADLQGCLEDYANTLTAASELAPLMDLETARELVSRCRRLLDESDDAEPTKFRLVQIAVRYLVLDDDGDSDHSSAFGFDDDVEVFNAMAARLGRDDLLVEP